MHKIYEYGEKQGAYYTKKIGIAYLKFKFN